MRIFLRRNGYSNGQVVKCPGTITDLYKLCELDHPVIFSNTGDIITSLDVIRDNDIVYVAKEGEDFKGDSMQATTSRAKAYQQFTAKKKEEREQFFKKTKKGKKGSRDCSETCKIAIGMMTFSRGYKRKRKQSQMAKLVFKKQVGKQMTASVIVAKDATVTVVIENAVAAFKLIDPSVGDNTEYVLLYSDLRTKVEFLPNSKEVAFTPRKYVELLGTYYSKLRLYLVSKYDWAASAIGNIKKDHLNIMEENEDSEDEMQEIQDSSSEDEVHFKGSTPDQYKTIQCFICNTKEPPFVHPSCSKACTFHQICIEEWIKNCKPENPKCPNCSTIDGEIWSHGTKETKKLTCEKDKGRKFRQYQLPKLVHELSSSTDSSEDEDATMPGEDSTSNQSDQPRASISGILSREDTTLNNPSRDDAPTSSDQGMQFRQVHLPAILASQGINVNEDDSGDNAPEITTDNGPTKRVVVIHRCKIKDELIQLFSDSDPATTNESLEFQVIDERGRTEEGQGAGVTRDVLATFWQNIFTSLTVGDVEKVPCIRHDYQKKQWEAIARILLFGLEICGYFPIGLSPAFLSTCLHGENSFSRDELLDCFLNFCSTDEREVFNSCLSGKIPYDDEDLMDALSSYKSYKKPTEKTGIREILTELAHQELVQKPRYVGELWSPIVASLREQTNFSSHFHIKEFTDCKKPTVKKVIKALKPNIKHASDQQSFDFVKKFIKSLDPAMLKTFLKFITGSDMMICDNIEVGFTLSEGYERRPIAHTCGPLLLIPSTYQSYNELAEEFNSILCDKKAWNFNIV